MKKVIVMGVFTDLGYGLSLEMLENEVHVIGIDKMPVEKSDEEEKLLRIGRNAFFQFEEFTDLMFKEEPTFSQIDTLLYTYDHTQWNEASLVDEIIEYCSQKKINVVVLTLHEKNNHYKHYQYSSNNHNASEIINYLKGYLEKVNIEEKK